MYNQTFYLNVFGALLQYGLVILIYYFLYKVIRLMYLDLNGVFRGNLSSIHIGKLMVIDDGNINLHKKTFHLDEKFSIGRSDENDIIIDDSYVSHYHVMIKKVQNNYIIEDLMSINHTYLNQKILFEETILKSGDIIKVGLVTFKFER